MTVQVHRTRPGFTLIELLVVIGIMAVLMGITVVVVTGVMRTQTGVGSSATISKAASEHDKQWKAAIDNAKQEFQEGKIPATLLPAVGNNRDKARTLYIRLRLEQEFPQSFAEARNGAQYPSLPDPNPLVKLGVKQIYVTTLQGVSAGTPEAESAVCLVMALNEARRGVVSNLEEGVGPSNLRPLGGFTVKTLVDLWGQPIAFRRNLDPNDKLSLSWLPEIYSAGPDKTFNTVDDLTSQSLRQLNARGER